MINIEKLLESKRVEVSFAEINVDSAYVKRFRKDHKLTQVALANIVGVTKKTVEKWEQGVNNIGGSSAVLLKLLNDNPELIAQLYSVNVGVTGKQERDEYQQIDQKVINSSSKPIASRTLKGTFAAVF